MVAERVPEKVTGATRKLPWSNIRKIGAGNTVSVEVNGKPAYEITVRDVRGDAARSTEEGE